METNVGRSNDPSDTFAFEARSSFARARDRLRGVEVVEDVPRVGDEVPEPRPVAVEAAATAAKTVGIVVVLIVAAALAIAGVLFGFAAVMSLITG